MKLWQLFVTKAINQFVSGRLFAFLTGTAVVAWLSLVKRLELPSTANLLTLLFCLYFGTKGIEWIGNAVGSIAMKPKAASQP